MDGPDGRSGTRVGQLGGELALTLRLAASVSVHPPDPANSPRDPAVRLIVEQQLGHLGRKQREAPRHR